MGMARRLSAGVTEFTGAQKEELSDIAADLFRTLQDGIELANGPIPFFHSPEAAITFEFQGKRYRLCLTEEDHSIKG